MGFDETSTSTMLTLNCSGRSETKSSAILTFYMLSRKACFFATAHVTLSVLVLVFSAFFIIPISFA